MEEFNILSIRCDRIKYKDYVFIKNRPCKINNIIHSFGTREGGNINYLLQGHDILTQLKYNIYTRGHKPHKLFVPLRKILFLISLNEKDHMIECLDDKNELFTYAICINKIYEQVKQHLIDIENSIDKCIYVTILYAPVICNENDNKNNNENDNNKYKIEHIIESYNLEYF